MIEKEALIESLKDAGCNKKIINTFANLLEQGEEDEAFEVLYNYRKSILMGFHKSKKKIDCLDYLIYKCKR